MKSDSGTSEVRTFFGNNDVTQVEKFDCCCKELDKKSLKQLLSLESTTGFNAA